MPATTEQQQALHTSVDTATGDDVLALRRQLAACLCTGVRHRFVHVRSQEELDLRVREALDGVAAFLQQIGGALTLVEAAPGTTQDGDHGAHGSPVRRTSTGHGPPS